MSTARRHELVNVRMLPPAIEDIVDAELVDDEDLVVPVRTSRSRTPTRERAAAPASRPRWAPPAAPRVKRDAAAQRAVEAHRRQLWRLAGCTAAGWAAAVLGVVLAWTWYRAWVIGMLVVLGVVTALLGSSASSLRRTAKRGGRGRCVGC